MTHGCLQELLPKRNVDSASRSVLCDQLKHAEHQRELFPCLVLVSFFTAMLQTQNRILTILKLVPRCIRHRLKTLCLLTICWVFH